MLKKHYPILDGLRGVAALVVVVFHFLEWVNGFNIVGHGYLAVDFFFCLSGFVIAYAYDDKIKEIGIKNFFVIRFIRLHPLVIVGGILGLLAFLFDPFVNTTEHLSIGYVILFFILTIFLIPFPFMPDRTGNLFGLNAPSWSLFWEYVINIVYAIFLCRIKRFPLIILTIVAAGLLGYIGYSSNGLLGGWGKDKWWDGVARVLYSFLAGLLICRLKWHIRSHLGLGSLVLLLMVPFTMPFFTQNWLIEVLLVIVCFPVLVLLGAGATLSKRMENFCNLSGRISYPLYMTHYCVIWIFANYYKTYKPDTTTLYIIITISTILLVLFAYVIMRVYDEPVRKFLTKQSKKYLQ